MATRKRHNSSKTKLKLALSDFRLIDVRTSYLKCEKFLEPAAVPKGVYSTSASARLGFPTPDQPTVEATKDELYFQVSITIVGRKRPASDSDKKSGVKSFSIETNVDAKFRARGKILSEDVVTDEIGKGLIAQVYPLVVSRVRAYAADMGFRGVRPDLGFNLADATIDASSDEKERVVAAY